MLLEYSQVLQSDPANLSPYLKHLREVFFANCSVPESLTEYHTTIKRISENVNSTRLNVPRAENVSAGVNTTISDQRTAKEPPIGDGFAFSGKRILNAASVVPLGPDYAALLSVCSLKAWIAPHLLAEVILIVFCSTLLSTKLIKLGFIILQAVRQLEELIVNVECETAYRIDPHAQHQISKMEEEAHILKQSQS